MVQKKTYSISELAQEFDVTTRSVRFYEDQGLLKPSRRGQTRIFSSKDRVRLKLILRGKRMGLSLAETKELFDLWDETTSGNEKQLLLMLQTITRRRQALAQQKEDIAIVEMEMENAEARCLEALSELQMKKTDGNTALTPQQHGDHHEIAILGTELRPW
ncbi:MAG: MerR family DNA-binding transcriptional regulator [Marinobacter sp.]|nr:MerR family DNA-binding transcriptional regulator [Marinobacter sp.]MCL1482488.1 MerR family DNA-binding transcriptional regulator [Marinobacter sp.]